MNHPAAVGLALLVVAAPAAPAAAEPASRTYAVAHAQAWIAVTRVAYAMSGWYVIAASEESGFVTVRKLAGLFGLPKPRVLVKVEPQGPSATRVTFLRAAAGPADFLHWWADGGESRQFFRALDDLLPAHPEPAPHS